MVTVSVVEIHKLYILLTLLLLHQTMRVTASMASVTQPNTVFFSCHHSAYCRVVRAFLLTALYGHLARPDIVFSGRKRLDLIPGKNWVLPTYPTLDASSSELLILIAKA